MNSEKWIRCFLKGVGINGKRSLPRAFPNVKELLKVAQDGQLSRQNFKVSGWINSCWVQFGQLGNLPKSKFTAFYPRKLQEHHLSSPWNRFFARSIRKRAEDPRHKVDKSDHLPDFPPVPNRLSGMDRYNLLFKPLTFTAFVGTSSVVGCTIWQYEEYRTQVSNGRFSFSNLTGSPSSSTSSAQSPGSGDQPVARRASELGIRFQSWWNSLSPGEKVFWPICAINGLIFCAWRVPFLTKSMVTYFSCSPMGRAVCWPMLFSTFSHYSFFHLCANMFVLHSFLPAAAQIMGKEQFLALYLTSGTVASLGSHFHKIFVGSSVPSLGASGAIMGVLGLVCTRMPDIQLGIIFLPGIQFTADTALKCILAIDVAGLVTGWKFMDHAAHLAGCLFGIAFSNWGKDTFWAFRDFIMTRWHRFRTQGIS